FDHCDLFAYLLGPLLPLGEFPLVFNLFGGRDQNVIVFRARGGEERLQSIIVFLKNRVVFVIVAARASDCRTEKDRAYGVGDVVQNLLPPLPQVARVIFIGVMTVERRGDQRVRIVGPEFVARDLLFDEPVIGFVFVERLDQVIAV